MAVSRVARRYARLRAFCWCLFLTPRTGAYIQFCLGIATPQLSTPPLPPPPALWAEEGAVVDETAGAMKAVWTVGVATTEEEKAGEGDGGGDGGGVDGGGVQWWRRRWRGRRRRWRGRGRGRGRGRRRREILEGVHYTTRCTPPLGHR
eukprot:scaffold80610_cov28-Tisochrysis_lutea.AAC.1